MFRKDRIVSRGGGVILYIKQAIQAFELNLDEEADGSQTRQLSFSAYARTNDGRECIRYSFIFTTGTC